MLFRKGDTILKEDVNGMLRSVKSGDTGESVFQEISSRFWLPYQCFVARKQHKIYLTYEHRVYFRSFIKSTKLSDILSKFLG